MKTLKALLTASRIRSLASPTTIQRGQDYYARNRVRSVSTMPNGIRATILGQRVYIVELTAIANSLGHHCSCPMGEQGDFCKHCVAVTISFLNDPPPEDVFPIEALRAQLAAETPPASPNSSSNGRPITKRSKTVSTNTRPSSPGPTPPSPHSAAPS